MQLTLEKIHIIYRGFEYDIWQSERGHWCQVGDITIGPKAHKGDAIKATEALIDRFHKLAKGLPE